MLRQLARLAAPVPAAGPRATAIAVYADATDRAFPAADLGYEGVACVDDAARALVLFCDLWEATGLRLMRLWASSLLDFLLYMQKDDGRFVNFIADWTGRRNGHGVTSFPGGAFWHARGVRALARAALALADDRARAGFERGLARVREERGVAADVRSIHALTALEAIRSGTGALGAAELSAWCDEIASSRRGDVLLDHPGQDTPHLWGHIQEGVLAEAGDLLGRPDLVAVARRSALAYLAPLVASSFDEPTVQPYGVASAAYSLERLAAVTGETLFQGLWRDAHAWFDGRNPARRPVYDREAGRVHDGIDDGALNPHSGAESNVVGAQTLLDDVTRALPRLRQAIESSFDADVGARLLETAEARSP